MAISLSSLKSSKNTNPPIVLLYGVDGVGKTSLAAEWPSPIYLPTEGERPPSDVEMATPGVIKSWDDLTGVMAELLAGGHEFKTVIIDSLDGLAPHIERLTAERIGARSIDDNSKGSSAAFGNGYKESEVEWAYFMSGCEKLSSAGLNVVLVAHPDIKRFDDPLNDPYERYIIRLNKRAGPVVTAKCDIVAFINYRISLKSKEVAKNKEVSHAVGGKERLIHLSREGGFDAKNRYGMPDNIAYRKGQGYAALSKFWTGAANDNAEKKEAA